MSSCFLDVGCRPIFSLNVRCQIKILDNVGCRKKPFLGHTTVKPLSVEPGKPHAKHFDHKSQVSIQSEIEVNMGYPLPHRVESLEFRLLFRMFIKFCEKEPTGLERMQVAKARHICRTIGPLF